MQVQEELPQMEEISCNGVEWRLTDRSAALQTHGKKKAELECEAHCLQVSPQSSCTCGQDLWVMTEKKNNNVNTKGQKSFLLNPNLAMGVGVSSR